jgi:PPOX class probable F420-dependent enzyme
MSFPDTHLDLLDAPGTAVFSTIAPSGLIQSTAVWYLRRGDALAFSFSDARKKLRNLQADARATALVIDPTNAFRTVEVRGKVTVALDEGRAFMAEVGAHYGADLSAFDQPGDTRYVVTLQPERVVANG